MSKYIFYIGACAIVFATFERVLAHRNNKYIGGYRMRGGYGSVTPLWHDLIKTLTVELSVATLMSNNIDTQFLSRLSIVLVGYVIFYELIEPYILSKAMDKLD